jgi:hypothetical protein
MGIYHEIPTCNFAYSTFRLYLILFGIGKLHRRCGSESWSAALRYEKAVRLLEKLLRGSFGTPTQKLTYSRLETITTEFITCAACTMK